MVADEEEARRESAEALARDFSDPLTTVPQVFLKDATPESFGTEAQTNRLIAFPTATSPAAGQGAWQVGPAFGAVYKGMPGLLFAALVQNPVSFAYTSSDRPALNTLLVQPIALAYVGKGFYLKSGDSTWSMGWHHGSATTLPLSFGVGYVLAAPPSNSMARPTASEARRDPVWSSRSPTLSTSSRRRLPRRSGSSSRWTRTRTDSEPTTGSSIPPRPDPEECRSACWRDPRCVAYSFVKPGGALPRGRCFLKSAAPAPQPNPCCFSWVKVAQ